MDTHDGTLIDLVAMTDEKTPPLLQIEQSVTQRFAGTVGDQDTDDTLSVFTRLHRPWRRGL